MAALQLREPSPADVDRGRSYGPLGTVGPVPRGDLAQELALCVWPSGVDHAPTTLALASSLADLESRGQRVPVVTCCVRGRTDSAYVEALLPWLLAHDKGVVVRTRARLASSLIEALSTAVARKARVAVELELAAVDARTQAVFLGARADRCSELLSQAQHLQAASLPVVARLLVDPELPPSLMSFRALCAALAAAGVSRFQLLPMRLEAEKMKAWLADLGDALAPAARLELARLVRSRAHARVPVGSASGPDLPALASPLLVASWHALRHTLRAGAPHAQECNARELVWQRESYRSVGSASLFEEKVAALAH